ncbi:methyltransferase, FxLD system [Nocardiopsis metallicus]|uniref:Protein-L-isoaspartate O-methyltransferase n=1 Tax=Nocardiopsis metallicus TaxID=179819 RepID=A0A840WCS5_9ACTN|nr:methyltransferase, FxLD system [Nocardiopsis metallicus]MBB5494820.1 protein-L-isoaspartate(D-aspartate) O-methyltransferase [Nocardiopsis metallicus]
MQENQAAPMPNATAVHTDLEAEARRAAMVERIKDRQRTLGAPLPTRIEHALTVVPRHLFTPGARLESAYGDGAVITKTDACGVNLSSVSAPATIASMLGQLAVEPGQRVLEIGSGGYNAALLAELVGPEGEVTTMDIDAEVVDRARQCLDRAGYGRVRTVCGDGVFGAPDFGPYDRLIVTVGAEDIPASWINQLTSQGRMVVPLRTRALMRSWALDRDGDRLVSRSHLMCGFVPMQGVGSRQRARVDLQGGAVTLWADEGPEVDASVLEEALSSPRVQAWSGVTRRRGEPFGDLDLWLATTLEGTCVLTATQDAVNRSVVAPSWRLGTPALVEGASLAYRAKQRPVGDDGDTFEFGAFAHGSDAQRLAALLAERFRVWDSHVRGRLKPQMEVCPSSANDRDLPSGCVVDKPHSRIVLSWHAPTT